MRVGGFPEPCWPGIWPVLVDKNALQVDIYDYGDVNVMELKELRKHLPVSNEAAGILSVRHSQARLVNSAAIQSL